MTHGIYLTIFYQPLFNAFVFLFDTFPWMNAGIAVIIFTILIKFILFPLSKKSIVTQLEMKLIEPELKLIQEKYKGNREEQAKQTMALYKASGISPFSSFFLILIQLPIIFALYKLFLNIKDGLPSLDKTMLYNFVHVPEKMNILFYGMDLSQKSLLFALFAAITTYIQMAITLPKVAKKEGVQSFKDDFARSMSLQMKYVLPIVIFFIAYNISSAVALYWFVGNIFMICQELYVRKHIKKPFMEKNGKIIEAKN